ncbi:hypothetical protein ABIB48_003014 [Arthrobacter sp. UYCu511]|uniref:DUF2971 domain-containing protein n=1 Tax=Arthrobacter sp. UYCu511 TaxID=3156337 RepID=UPI003394695D
MSDEKDDKPELDKPEAVQEAVDAPTLPARAPLAHELAPELLAQFQGMASQPWMNASSAASIMQNALALQNLSGLSELQGRFKDIVLPQLTMPTSWMLSPLASAAFGLPSGTRETLRLMGETFSRTTLSSLAPATANIQAILAAVSDAARGALLPGFATKTQEFLTTDRQLRYRWNRPVWHYTNGHALLSILWNGQLWASSPQHLNDASEMTHGFHIISQALTDRIIEAKQADDYDPADWLVVEETLGEVVNEKYVNKIINDVYYISASTERDSLTLWRNYASGDGFAIGIDTAVGLSADGLAVDMANEDKNIRGDIPLISGWYRVTYSETGKQKLARSFIRNAIEDIRNTAPVNLPKLVRELQKQAVILASTMKHVAFKDEQEVRWITTNFTAFDPVHYEHGRKSIVPVLKVMTSSSKPNQPLPLKGLWCSPIPDASITRTIEGLLQQRGYEVASRNVHKSVQPFKG